MGLLDKAGSAKEGVHAFPAAQCNPPCSPLHCLECLEPLQALTSHSLGGVATITWELAGPPARAGEASRRLSLHALRHQGKQPGRPREGTSCYPTPTKSAIWIRSRLKALWRRANDIQNACLDSHLQTGRLGRVVSGCIATFSSLGLMGAADGF
jgi:hypothetical protein